MCISTTVADLSVCFRREESTIEWPPKFKLYPSCLAIYPCDLQLIEVMDLLSSDEDEGSQPTPVPAAAKKEQPTQAAQPAQSKPCKVGARSPRPRLHALTVCANGSVSSFSLLQATDGRKKLVVGLTGLQTMPRLCPMPNEPRPTLPYCAQMLTCS